MKTITEGSARIFVSDEAKISKKLEIFYNPIMKLNRDVSVLLINSLDKYALQMADPLAGTGIRGLRFIKELEPGKIENLSFNDLKPGYIEKNLKLNEITNENIFVFSKDANLFLLESRGFDYIDIDPFGSPNPFLESAIIRLSRGGILAVTATDTAALAGSSKEACLRKYWAKPLRNEFMHETGIRILIRKIQLIGAGLEKALTPIFSYSKDHYYRIFFKCQKGKTKTDDIISQHKFLIYNRKTSEIKLSDTIFNDGGDFDYAGPLWVGHLWDKALAEKMYEKCDKENKKLLTLVSAIRDESKIDSVGFYDLHILARQNNKPIPKVEDALIESQVSKTHFIGWGVRSKSLISLP